NPFHVARQIHQRGAYPGGVITDLGETCWIEGLRDVARQDWTITTALTLDVIAHHVLHHRVAAASGDAIPPRDQVGILAVSHLHRCRRPFLFRHAPFTFPGCPKLSERCPNQTDTPSACQPVCCR